MDLDKSKTSSDARWLADLISKSGGADSYSPDTALLKARIGAQLRKNCARSETASDIAFNHKIRPNRWKSIAASAALAIAGASGIGGGAIVAANYAAEDVDILAAELLDVDFDLADPFDL